MRMSRASASLSIVIKRTSRRFFMRGCPLLAVKCKAKRYQKTIESSMVSSPFFWGSRKGFFEDFFSHHHAAHFGSLDMCGDFCDGVPEFAIKHAHGGKGDEGRSETEGFKDLCGFTGFAELVLRPDTFDRNGSCECECFAYSTRETAAYLSFFDCDDRTCFFCSSNDRFFVERLDCVRINNTTFDSV